MGSGRKRRTRIEDGFWKKRAHDNTCIKGVVTSYPKEKRNRGGFGGTFYVRS